jgi:hypothetical protein
MSSWSYAYFFSDKNGKLDFSPSSNLVFQPEFISDTLIINMKEDQDGHCVEDTAENRDNKDFVRQLIEEKTDAYQVTYKSQKFFFNVTFANCGNHPYISVAWQNNVFMRLDHISKNAFLNKIEIFAAAVKSSYVLFLKDTPGFLEDRFFFIEETPVIDNTLSSGYNFKIDFVWVSNDKPLVILQDAVLQFIKENDHGYKEFKCLM